MYKFCIERTSSRRGVGGVCNTGIGWYGCKIIICVDCGAWPVRHLHMRMEQHVYLVGSRNYSNFNNLSAARCGSLTNTHQFWLADVGQMKEHRLLLLYYNLFIHSFSCLCCFACFICGCVLANHILNNSHRSRFDIESPFCIPMNESAHKYVYSFFSANSILINIVRIRWISIHVCAYL